ncbi:alpha/beta hydrolase family protein [Winogradskyella psychrotolerans]|uniref:alpha/beta hydrolase family protein n=1 Tax=Winogradskyella psychrotolerans TaxID=1344585 RepID=UPI001C07A36D|nr:alpha/beta hydrolase [Winogradskyella psychrotolerans]MBU2928203.1 lysophospholipase [Winogradskyella psychrotolerans]
MKKTSIILFLFISNFIFSQEELNNEKGIKNIQNYNTKEISKKVNEKITIFGTLITPKSDYNKILVIISGTGKISQKAHNYLTECLLENNIGVFKFDKRGVGKSTGEYNDQPKIYTNDFIEIYRELEKSKFTKNKKIGFLGHSLGGIVTTLSIEQNIKPDFLIQWSAPIGKPRELLKYQIENGIKNYDKLIIGKNTEERINSLNYVYELIDKNPNKNTWELWKIGKKESKKINVNKKSFSNYLMPHNVEFARIDNTKTYQNINFPTLIIIGKEDILVDPNQSKTEINRIENSNIEFKEIENLDHFMTKKGTNQLTNEIYDIDSSFKEYLVNWIIELKK